MGVGGAASVCMEGERIARQVGLQLGSFYLLPLHAREAGSGVGNGLPL